MRHHVGAAGDLPLAARRRVDRETTRVLEGGHRLQILVWCLLESRALQENLELRLR